MLNWSLSPPLSTPYFRIAFIFFHNLEAFSPVFLKTYSSSVSDMSHRSSIFVIYLADNSFISYFSRPICFMPPILGFFIHVFFSRSYFPPEEVSASMSSTYNSTGKPYIVKLSCRLFHSFFLALK